MHYCETLCCVGICFLKEDKKCATCEFGKLNIVLDLDETLVHAQHISIKCEHLAPFCQFEDYNIYKRPHVDIFLDAVFEKYNVYIWTAACKSYANVILKHLLQTTQIPVRVLTRKQTMFRKELTGLYYSRQDAIKIKPLGKLKCNLARTILIDDTKSCFLLDALNGIQITEFNNPQMQFNDNELMLILQKLEEIADLRDVRKRIT